MEKELNCPDKSKNNPFKTHKLCKDLVGNGEYFRIQIPSEIAKDFPVDARFWIGHEPGTQNIQLFLSGTTYPNPLEKNICRPKKLKQEDFATGAGTNVELHSERIQDFS